ncbi:DUF4936 family protein [Limnobacter parvus]|uniref:DUF4936 family protein n=1 Tax=Limnobacter parvus TaxID=2939690 RepID=A0ABT1XI15_9BURK|nr:DUF4936 family protein [Limnobacter parvus]MCR2746931.1 DUF4936 family protein [Limnobacter parvus]
MMRQLFIYYRIPKADIALGLTCAGQLMDALKNQGLGSGELFQREEADKPYFTLMEVITPATAHADHIEEFTRKVQIQAAASFALLPNPPSRHVEVFSPVGAKGSK